MYDPDTGVFTLVSPMPSGWRSSCTATLVNDGTVLVAGEPWPPQIYTPTGLTTGTWAPTNGTMQFNRYAHSATLLQDGTVLVVYNTANAEIWYAPYATPPPGPGHSPVALSLFAPRATPQPLSRPVFTAQPWPWSLPKHID